MLLGRISRVYFVILVVWLVKKARFQKSFELFRGHYDVFSNTKCSQTDHDHGDSDRSYRDCSPHSCQKYEANCKDMPSCSYCICNSDKNYTYIENDDGDGRCVRDEEVLPESGCYRFADGSFLRFLSHDEQCSKQELGACVHKQKISAPIFAENDDCFVDWKHSTYMPHGKSRKLYEGNENYFDLEATNKSSVKLLKVNGTSFKKWNGSLIKLNIVCKRTPMIITPSGKKPKPKMPSKGLPTLPKGIPTIHEPSGKEYKSSPATPTKSSKSKTEQKEQHCVLLKFETLPKYSKTTTEISVASSDTTTIIKPSLQLLPSFATSTTLPSKSNHSTLEATKDHPSNPTKATTSRSTSSIKPTDVNTMVTEFSNGKKETNILTSSPTLTTSLSPKSYHSTLEATNEHPTHTTKAITSRSTSSIKPIEANTMVTVFSNGKKKTNILTSSPTLTTSLLSTSLLSTSLLSTSLLSTSQEHPYHTTKTITGFPMSTTPSSKFVKSSSSKTVVITVPIALLIVIVCVAGGLCVIYRRRRRGQPEIKTNEEEMQSREAQNYPKTFSEDPSQTYEPLKKDRRETGDEHLYQGLVGLHSQDKDTSVYDYIDDKSATNPGTEGEYSYASNEILPRSFAPSQPLPPAPVVYETLEEPDGSDNPAFEHDKLSDSKGHGPKNKPFDEKCKSPVYQTLEEQEAVQNPKLTELNDELTDKSLDSVEESVEKQSPPNPVYQTLEEQEAVVQNPKNLDSVGRSLDQQSQNPVYQTLEEPEAVQNPKSKLDDESTDKSLDSVAKESLDRQSQNPVYQTLENPNRGQDTSSETFGDSSVGGMPADDSAVRIG